MNAREKKYVKKIGRLMKVSRKGAHLTQVEVSKKLGIEQGTLSKMENGILMPSAVQWFDFCRIVKIDTDCLLTGKPAPARHLAEPASETSNVSSSSGANESAPAPQTFKSA